MQALVGIQHHELRIQRLQLKFEPAGITTGQVEHHGDQLPEALRFCGNQRQLCLARPRHRSLQALGMTGDHGDGGAQFMGNAINEATFPLPSLCQASLELVEGLNNRLQFPRLPNRIQSPLAQGIRTQTREITSQRLQRLG